MDSKKNEFLGGRFPKPIAEGIAQLAKEAGLNKTEYLEKIFAEQLDKNKDGVLSEEEVRQLVRKEMTVTKPEAITNDEEDDYDDLEEDEDDDYSFVDDYDYETDPDDLFEPSSSSNKLDRNTRIAIIGGLPAILPPLLAKELNCLLIAAYTEAEQIGSEPIEVTFMEQLADKLTEVAEEQTGYTCDNEDYDDVVPFNAVTVFDGVLIDAVNEQDQITKPVLYPLLAKLLKDVAADIYLKSREVTLSFTREQYDAIDRLIIQINEERSEKNQISSLEGMIVDMIGENLIVEGSGFLGPRDRQMVNIGRQIKASA